MRVNRLLSLLGIILTTACDGAADSNGPEHAVHRTDTVFCVGVDSDSHLVEELGRNVLGPQSK
jgi:hypothetical protein